MKTECALCSKKLDGWREYAEHILEKHPTDEVRVAWAKEVLSPSAPKELDKSRRRFPKYLTKQLGDKEKHSDHDSGKLILVIVLFVLAICVMILFSQVSALSQQISTLRYLLGV